MRSLTPTRQMPAPRDWSWPLVGAMAATALGIFGVLATHHRQTPFVTVSGVTGSLLFGAQFVVVGTLLLRQSPRVRALSRLAADPRGCGVTFIGLGAGLIASNLARILAPQLFDLFFLLLIIVPLVVSVVGLALLERWHRRHRA